MTFYECPVCYHTQPINGPCLLCGRKRGLVEVPTPAEIRDRSAVVRMDWTLEQEQNHRCGAYRTRRWHPPELPGQGGRVQRKKAKK